MKSIVAGIGVLVSVVLLWGCQSKPAVSTRGFFWESAARPADCCVATGGKRFAIAAGGNHAASAGSEIFSAGGNAVDAAVAVAFALAVEASPSSGMGGGGFATVYLPATARKAARAWFLDFRETAPAAATPKVFLDKAGNVVPNLSVLGGKAVATPGFVKGWYELHQQHGKLPWKTLLGPAIRLAEAGIAVDEFLRADLTSSRDVVEKDKTLSEVFLAAANENRKLVQTDLAWSLKQVAAHGENGFYQGELAKRIVSATQNRGGILTLADLRNYRTKKRKPIAVPWREGTIYTAPPPSAGGFLLAQTLTLLSHFSPQELVKQPEDFWQLLTEIYKRGYADRSQFIADPDFVNTGYEKLLTTDYLRHARKQFSKTRATPSQEFRAGSLPKAATEAKSESPDTTHFSVMDAEGNAIAATITINGEWGAGFVAEGTGIVMNNEMDDFTAKPGAVNIYGLTSGANNLVAPLKRPVSSMTPTLLVREGKPVLALGAAGGSRIITGVLQTLLSYELLQPGDLRHAVFSPRLHHQWLPDKLEIEADFSPALVAALKQKGHTIAAPPYAVRVQAVAADPSGVFSAVFDPRDAGSSVSQ